MSNIAETTLSNQKRYSVGPMTIDNSQIITWQITANQQPAKPRTQQKKGNKSNVNSIKSKTVAGVDDTIM